MDAYVYEVARTPRGRGSSKGALASVRPIELVGHVLAALRERGIDPAWTSDLVLGCSTQTGEQGGDLAQIAVVHAGWAGVTGATVSRFCCSGLEALRVAAMQADAGPRAGEGLVLAGGVESMSRVPMFSDGAAWFADAEVSARTSFVHMGVAADLVATLEGIERTELEAVALGSHRRSARAQAEGRFDRELVPVGALRQDEGVREGLTAEGLAALEPAFAALGAEQGDARCLARHPQLDAVAHRHTVATSPGLADCAALAVVGSRAAGDAHGLKPRARLRAFATYAEEPVKMLTGNVEGARRALKAAGMAASDVDVFEVNESFAVVPVHFQHALEVDPERLNPNGGALSVGHPLGATGGVLLANALAELERTDGAIALCSVCGGAGVTMTMIVERV